MVQGGEGGRATRVGSCTSSESQLLVTARLQPNPVADILQCPEYLRDDSQLGRPPLGGIRF
jgi:hypothetical protein